jgi:hypothetical protein
VNTQVATSRRYHVALSFAGEDRAYVERVAAELRAGGVNAFYDRYEEVELWGKNLYTHLSDVYSKQAHFTVVFISRHYRDKLWTNHERESAQSRAFLENREYILPVRFDNTEIPGIPPTVGYLDLSNRSPEGLAGSIIQKLRERHLLEPSHIETELSIVQIFMQALAGSSKDHPANFAKAANDYVDRCCTLYQNMRILAMPKPVELSHIFTQVRIADKIRGRQRATEEEMIREVVSGRGSKERTGFNAISLFENSSRSVLLGRPGSGKSTFLKYMLLRELQREAILQVPILLPLNELGQRNKSVFDNLAAIFERCQIASPGNFLEKLLSYGRVRLLIDGLDELRSDDRRAVIKEIQELMVSYPNCSFLVTCRTAAYEYWFGDCLHYEVQRFSKRSIIAFVLRWFSSEKKKARELLTQILANSRMRDLCSSPLMLTIVCIGFDEGIDLSNNRAEIYKHAIDALLRKWDASRSIYRDNIYRTLSPKRREDLLSDFAARTFVENQIVVPAPLAEELVSKFLKTMPTSPDISVEDDAEVVLQAIEIQHGLIERRSDQFWVFAHLTFQEFFVAQYLVSRDPALRSYVAGTHIDRPEWREVIMLTAALLPNADDFVLEILKALTKIGYGEFFVRKTLSEIKTAQQSIEYKRFQSESLFPRNDERPVKYRQSAFGVIEGGVRLTVEEIQLALSKFRERDGISAPDFDYLVALKNDTLAPAVAWIEMVKAEWAQRETEPDAIELEHPINVGLPSELEALIGEIQWKIVAALENSSGGNLSYDTRLDVRKALLMSYAAFQVENMSLPEKLNSLYDPNNLFELTSRKSMFILPNCLEDCLSAASDVLNELNVIATRSSIKEHFQTLSIDPNKVEEIILDAVADDIKGRLVDAAAKNDNERAKLRAFVAGDTLAEILMSQAFLTPIVREAAVRTLNNIISLVPPPPTRGPTADSRAMRQPRVS